MAARAALCLLLLALMVPWSMPAGAAEDHIVARGVLVDPGGGLDVDSVAGMAFAPAGPILSGGYTAAAHWLRLTVRPRADGGELILRIRPTFLDTVALYAPDPGVSAGWRRQVTGDRIPFAARDLMATTLGFAIRPAAPETTYYLRLETTSTSLLSVQALDPRDARLADLRLDLFQVIYFGLMCWILFWSINEFAVDRDRVTGWFALTQATYIVYNAALMGYLAPLVPTRPLDGATSFLVCATPLLTLVFHRVLVARFSPRPIALRALDGLIVLDVVAMVVLLAGFTRSALQLNALVIVAAAPVFILLAATVRAEVPPGRIVLRAVYLLQAASLLISMVPLFGLVSAIEWNLHATLIHGMISAILIFFLLHRRARVLQREGVRAAIGLGLARQQLEMERRQHEIQSRFMAMLTHELKTPLSVARLSLDAMPGEGEPKRRLDRALGNMNAIIDRCAQADQIEQRTVRAQPERCDPADALREAAAVAVAGRGEAARLRLSIDPLPVIATDRQLLAVILGNLIDNALKYAPKNGMVDIRAQPAPRGDARGIAIEIENPAGPAGLPDPARVFEKFYRGPRARGRSGSGLGLYIVRGIAELLGGEVAYDVVEGRARFKLWLPC